MFPKQRQFKRWVVFIIVSPEHYLIYKPGAKYRLSSLLPSPRFATSLPKVESVFGNKLFRGKKDRTDFHLFR